MCISLKDNKGCLRGACGLVGNTRWRANWWSIVNCQLHIYFKFVVAYQNYFLDKLCWRPVDN
jgi:hypothetical protein